MDSDMIIPGPKTKAAIALLERHRRRGAQRLRDAQAAPKLRTPEPATKRSPHQIPPTASTISDASRQLGLTMRAIRLYEDMGLISCSRGVKNARILDESAKARLRTVVELKRMGLTISEIADLLPESTPRSPALRARLEDHLATIEQQRMAIIAYLAGLPAA
jgi:DNA-binding transcriptional MerR regulator